MRVVLGSTSALALLVLSTATVASAGRSFSSTANAICESYYVKLNAIPKPSSNGLKVAAAYERRALPLAVSEYDRFKRMTPPATDKNTYAAWLSVTGQEVDLVRQSITAAEAGHTSTFLSLLDQADRLDSTRYDKLAKQMGFTICAQPTSKTR
jgi:hypothetical protein